MTRRPFEHAAMSRSELVARLRSSTRSIRAPSRTPPATAGRSRRHHRAAAAMSPRSASTRSGCRRSSSRRWPTWATTSPTTAPSTRCSARSRISTRWSPGARARAQGDHRPGAVAHLRPASLVHGEPRRAATIPRPTGTSGPTPSRTAPRPTTGCRCSAARPGSGTARAAVLHAQFPGRAARPQLPQSRVQDALLDAVRFWLERGVDGFRLDTVNYYFHDKQLRDNPPMPRGRRPAFRRQSLSATRSISTTRRSRRTSLS